MAAPAWVVRKPVEDQLGTRVFLPSVANPCLRRSKRLQFVFRSDGADWPNRAVDLTCPRRRSRVTVVRSVRSRHSVDGALELAAAVRSSPLTAGHFPERSKGILEAVASYRVSHLAGAIAESRSEDRPGCLEGVDGFYGFVLQELRELRNGCG